MNGLGQVKTPSSTSWLINDCSNGSLTAGHCTSNISVLQFNVPLSTASGALQNPPPEDQYAIDPASVQSNGGQGIGNDYAYFGTFPNTNTGLTAAQAQGAVFTIASPPSFNPAHQIRITGFGTDSTPATHNQVQQTHFGPWVTFSGTTLQYQTDTTGGNSGSPVIHEQSGNAIGIHTHGGCNSSGGQNSGTGLNHCGFQALLANPQGVCFGGGLSEGQPMPGVIAPGVVTDVFLFTVGALVGGPPTLHYRTAGGAFQTQALINLGGGNWRGALPALACGDTPEWYFSADLSGCGSVTLPSNAPAGVFSAAVGVQTLHFADDFELDKGWSTAILGASSGQWERGVPVNDPGWAYDPVSDGDGSGRCFVTQNQVGNTDVDNGAVELTTPALSLAGLSDVSLSYLYFLNLTESGQDFLRVAVSTNGLAGPFVTVVSHGTGGDLAWRSQTITAADLAAAGVGRLTNDVRVRFTANDSDPQSIVEAGVDRFEVSTISCGGAGSLGTSYCTSTLNSTGAPALITATGSVSVALNDLTLLAQPVMSTPGIFFFGDGQAQTPFGNGSLCLSGTLVRLVPAVVPAGNVAQRVVDLSALAIGPGTQTFQYWFRDPVAGGAGFDLSNGLEIVFTP